MIHRPRLARHVRVLRRTDESVQVGVGTSDGIVLDHLSAEQYAFLFSLGMGLDSEYAGAPSPPQSDELISLLDRHGLLERRSPAAPGGSGLRSRSPRIAVQGAGALVPAMRSGLAEAGYRVVTTAHPRGVDPLTTARPPRRQPAHRADLAVLIDRGGVPFFTGEPWREAGIAHLPVVIDGTHVTVGPLVDGHGPCLRCLDLTRSDRDPSWPVLLAQVAGYDATDGDEGPSTPDEIVQRSLAIAVAVAAVHAHLTRSGGPAGGPLPASPRARIGARGTSTTWRLPGPDIDLHAWHVHPRCPAHDPSATMKR